MWSKTQQFRMTDRKKSMACHINLTASISPTCPHISGQAMPWQRKHALSGELAKGCMYKCNNYSQAPATHSYCMHSHTGYAQHADVLCVMPQQAPVPRKVAENAEEEGEQHRTEANGQQLNCAQGLVRHAECSHDVAGTHLPHGHANINLACLRMH